MEALANPETPAAAGEEKQNASERINL